jgi:hypothetical protein
MMPTDVVRLYLEYCDVINAAHGAAATTLEPLGMNGRQLGALGVDILVQLLEVREYGVCFHAESRLGPVRQWW